MHYEDLGHTPNVAVPTRIPTKSTTSPVTLQASSPVMVANCSRRFSRRRRLKQRYRGLYSGERSLRTPQQSSLVRWERQRNHCGWTKRERTSRHPTAPRLRLDREISRHTRGLGFGPPDARNSAPGLSRCHSEEALFTCPSLNRTARRAGVWGNV